MSSGPSAPENALRLPPGLEGTNERRAVRREGSLARCEPATLLAVSCRRGEASAYRPRDVCDALGVYALVHLFAVHRHVLGRRQAEAQLVAPHDELSDCRLIAYFC